MNPEQEMVRNFHELVGATSNEWPTLPSVEDRALRVNLINEEAGEFQDAANDGDLVGMVDALIDLLYVVYGAGLCCGADLEPLFHAVHKANMLKAPLCGDCGGSGFGGADDYGIGMDCGACGGLGRRIVRRADGKAIKPEGWQHPDLAELLYRQIPERTR